MLLDVIAIGQHHLKTNTKPVPQNEIHKKVNKDLSKRTRRIIQSVFKTVFNSLNITKIVFIS